MSVTNPSIFWGKVVSNFVVIFVITRRIPPIAIQELVIFVLNVRDFLSVEEFSRPFSRDRSFVKSG